jgi:hypothetical protein
MSKKKYSQLIFLALVATTLLRCGVKGDPLPPDSPAMIGRGHVNYKGAFVDEKPTQHDEKIIQSPKGAKSDEGNGKSDDDESDE